MSRNNDRKAKKQEPVEEQQAVAPEAAVESAPEPEQAPAPVQEPVVVADPVAEYGDAVGSGIVFIEQSLNEFSAATGSGHTSNDKAAEFRKLHAAIRRLTTLRGTAFRTAFFKVVAIISQNQSGAFGLDNRFKHVELIADDGERKAFVTLLNAIIRFAHDKNKATFRQRVNITRLIEMLDPALHNEINSVFPG